MYPCDLRLILPIPMDVDVETTSNADLYIVTPPAYTQSIADGERRVDAEAVQEDKPHTPQHAVQYDALGDTSPRAMSDDQCDARPTTPLQVLQQRARERTGDLAPTGPTPVLSHHLTHPAIVLSLIGARTCSILPDRPAIWLVRKKKMALSPLAAAVLVKEGLLDPRNLELLVLHLTAPAQHLTSLGCRNTQPIAAMRPIPSRASCSAVGIPYMKSVSDSWLAPWSWAAKPLLSSHAPSPASAVTCNHSPSRPRVARHKSPLRSPSKRARASDVVWRRA
jgi:hypothetical protein